mmetsp:Transcript_10444/g.28540  ORF Transcript_10444/g.28540 Transcript_10444/m.28540 type:complete len:216 (+) Transcript_10444:438-1085(+)
MMVIMVGVVIMVVVLVRLVGAIRAGALVIMVIVVIVMVVVIVVIVPVRLVGAVRAGALVIMVIVVMFVRLVTPKAFLDNLVHLLKVPPAHTENVSHIHPGSLPFFHRCQPVYTSDSLLHPIHVPTRDQIDLVQHNAIRKCNLPHALVHLPLRPLLVQMQLHMLCVNKRHNAVQAHVLRDGRLEEKRLRNRTRRSKPRGLDHHSVKLVPLRLDQRR